MRSGGSDSGASHASRRNTASARLTANITASSTRPITRPVRVRRTVVVRSGYAQDETIKPVEASAGTGMRNKGVSAASLVSGTIVIVVVRENKSA